MSDTDPAKQAIATGTTDPPPNYAHLQAPLSLLKGLVLEGLYALVESKVSIRCRKKDTEVVKKAIEAAKKEYSEKLKGREVEVTVDEKENLPEESAGGVVIFNGTGKIEINNTFEERLKLLETDALPSVRLSLFGENENRRFKD